MQVTTMDVEYSYQSINSHLLSEVEAEGGKGRVGYIWNNFLTQKVPPPRDVFSPSVPTIHKYHCHVVTYVQISFCEQGKHGRRQVLHQHVCLSLMRFGGAKQVIFNLTCGYMNLNIQGICTRVCLHILQVVESIIQVAYVIICTAI